MKYRVWWISYPLESLTMHPPEDLLHPTPQILNLLDRQPKTHLPSSPIYSRWPLWPCSQPVTSTLVMPGSAYNKVYRPRVPDSRVTRHLNRASRRSKRDSRPLRIWGCNNSSRGYRKVDLRLADCLLCSRNPQADLDSGDS